jgi:hypothetical protein
MASFTACISEGRGHEYAEGWLRAASDCQGIQGAVLDHQQRAAPVLVPVSAVAATCSVVEAGAMSDARQADCTHEPRLARQSEMLKQARHKRSVMKRANRELAEGLRYVKAERDRFRAALEEIRALAVEPGSWWAQYNRVQTIALRALGTENGSEEPSNG